MPFTYTFDSKNAIANAVHIDGSYLTLETPGGEIYLNDKRFNVNLETLCQIYPKLLSFPNFRLIPFYKSDREHKEYFRQSHPPSAYSDMLSLLSGTTFSGEHFHFRCVGKKGEDITITLEMLKEISAKFLSFQRDKNLREQIKDKVMANVKDEGKLTSDEAQRLKDHLEVSKEYFPSKEIEKMQQAFLTYHCENLIGPLEIAPHDVLGGVPQSAELCRDFSRALPAPVSQVSVLPYVVASLAVLGTFFCFRRCRQKVREEDDVLSAEGESSVKKEQ